MLTCPAGAQSDTASDGLAEGKFVRLLKFEDEGAAPVDTLIGSELDGRLYTDLLRVSSTRNITPTAEFYIRTAASRLLPAAAQWQISIDGMVEKSRQIGIGALHSSARPMGTHLMECAGNVRLTRFGLISVANWVGVSVVELLDEAKARAGWTWVQIVGFDEYASESRTSIPGASWIFPISALRTAGAFLATRMNGQLLTPDHGAPVRLVVPGWYGCACIKWVNRITVVDDGAEATSQMQEYAARTLQVGIPQMARDYDPAIIDAAAMPVRVEQWKLAGKMRYRLAGIAWGGAEPIRNLQIRFNPEEEFVTVSSFHSTNTDSWTPWTHTWTPGTPGTYHIQLRVADPAVRARKLDSGYYVRTVTVHEV